MQAGPLDFEPRAAPLPPPIQACTAHLLSLSHSGLYVSNYGTWTLIKFRIES